MGQTTEEGIDDILSVYFATPTDFTVRLGSDTTIADDAVYADLTEVTGSGYAGITVQSVTISTTLDDDEQAARCDVTFHATGTWTAANIWFVTRDDGAGNDILVCWNYIEDGPITLNNGEYLSISPVLIGAG